MVTITVDSQLSGLVLNYQLFLFNWGKGRGGTLSLFFSLENLVCEVHTCFTDDDDELMLNVLRCHLTY